MFFSSYFIIYGSCFFRLGCVRVKEKIKIGAAGPEPPYNGRKATVKISKNAELKFILS